MSTSRPSSPPPSSPPRPSYWPPTPRLSSPPPLPYEPVSGPRRKRRRLLQRDQDPELINVTELQPLAIQYLESDELFSLRTLVNDYDQNPDTRTILNSFVRHYPNAFSLKLAHLLRFHPPLHIRAQIIALLHQILTQTHAANLKRIRPIVLLQLKPVLLQSVKLEDSAPTSSLLSEIIPNVASRVYDFPEGNWVELLEYVYYCIHSDSELWQEMGLKLFADCPDEGAASPDHRKFWNRSFHSLQARILRLFDCPSEKFQALAFDASVSLVRVVKDLGIFQESDVLFPRMMGFINRYPQAEIVLERLERFAGLADQVGEFFIGNLREVLDCMLKIAEIEDVRNDIRCAAIQVLKELDDSAMDQMENLMVHLSPEDLQRIFRVLLDMLSGIEDTPTWYDVDNVNSMTTGISDSYQLGIFLLHWVCFEANGLLLLPLVIEIIPACIASEDWRKRHAGMITLGAVAEGEQTDIKRSFKHVERMILMSLSDRHPRVSWAAIDAIKCLILNKGTAPHVQYRIKFLPELINIIKSSFCFRLQAHAALVLRCLVTNCGLDGVVSFLEEIVAELFVLLKKDKQKLQEEAVETLTSVAVLSPAYFHRYYDRTMESLKAILFRNYSSSTPKFLLRAKSLECMSTIVLRIEQDKFQDKDAIRVMESLISLGNLASAYQSIRIHILKALDQFCRFPGMDIGKYINKLMPMLFQSAKLNVQKASINYSYDPNGKYSVQTERVLACNILSHCAGRLGGIFYPWVSEVCNIFPRLFECSDKETQKASVSATPNLLLSAKSAAQCGQQSQRLAAFFVQSLVKALIKEPEEDVCITILRSLAKCIQISGSIFTNALIKLIVGAINHILCMQSRKTLEMERGQQLETSEGESEKEQEEEIIRSANHLIKTMIETFDARFSPYVDDLMSTVALLWGDDFPDTVKAIAISTFNNLVHQCPDKLQMYHDKYTSVLMLACCDESPEAQLEAARGIGFCASFGGDKFKTIANVAISSLYSVIERGSSSGGDRAEIYDVAVSALGKICEFHRDHIEGPEVVPIWLNFLPLRSDFNEARRAHGQLSRMLQRLDVDLLGPNNQNLPKILSISREILSQSGNLATEETITVITDFLKQHDAMP